MAAEETKFTLKDSPDLVTFTMRDSTKQLDPSICEIRALKTITIDKLLRQYSERSCALVEVILAIINLLAHSLKVFF